MTLYVYVHCVTFICIVNMCSLLFISIEFFLLIVPIPFNGFYPIHIIFVNRLFHISITSTSNYIS